MVKGTRFADFRDVGAPVTTAKIYDAQGADELVFLDIAASQERRDILLDVVGKVAEACFMPLTAGGGVRTLADFRNLLLVGADKVAINSAAVESPALITEAARRFGAQCVVVSIDYKRGAGGRPEVFTHAGTTPTGLDPVLWARRAVASGAGEVLLTSIDREGTLEGYDVGMIRAVTEAVDVPVIASGGVGNLQHFVDGLRLGGASAVSAGSIFHFTDQSVIKAKTFMKQAGVEVRW